MNLKELRVATVIAPLLYLVGIEILGALVLARLLGNRTELRLLVIFALLVAGIVPFSFWVFSIIERQQRQLHARLDELHQANEEIVRRNRQLDAINTAITSISGALDLQSVLQNITDAARILIPSRYAALGVANPEGKLIRFITSGITQEEREAIGPLPQGHGLLRVLIEEGKPIRVPDIASDPRSHGFPPHHPPMKTLLGVPILSKGQSIGDLYLAERIGAVQFSQQDQDLLMLLANHAAVAVDNATLYEDVRAARDRLSTWNEELEAKVAERTEEIERYSRELTTRVLRAQEEERKRIARELHDETAQSLSTLLISLDLLEPQLGTSDREVDAEFERLRNLVRRTLENTRALAHDLRPTILDDFGLVAALKWFADEFRVTYGIPAEVSVQGEVDGALEPEVELALFRIAQEALINSGKYAGAERTFVTLTFQNGSVELVTRDDGKGFDVEQVQRASREGGLGLYGMRERAELLGAKLEIESLPGVGTTVRVTAPIASHSPPSGNGHERRAKQRT